MVRKHQTRNLEIPGSMLTHRPGMMSYHIPNRLTPIGERCSERIEAAPHVTYAEPFVGLAAARVRLA